MTLRYSLLLAASLLCAAVPGARAAGDPLDPNWPCFQRKVPELSLATVWNGPDITPVAQAWQQDPEISGLVEKLAARRTPLDVAAADIKALAERAGPNKDQRLLMLFAGLFDHLSQERSDVMNGIDRFATKQRQIADNLRQETSDLDKLRNDPNADQTAVARKFDELTWQTRLFDDRKKSLSYVCDVPTTIEQRLYQLGKLIQQEM